MKRYRRFKKTDPDPDPEIPARNCHTERKFYDVILFILHMFIPKKMYVHFYENNTGSTPIPVCRGYVFTPPRYHAGQG
jgi:hypothetical protein